MRLKTKWIKIRNREAGEFEIYLDWSIPNELVIYVDRPEATGEFESFAEATINLETGAVN